MRNVCNVRMTQAMGDVIFGIGIGTAAADSIGYRAPTRYRSNPTYLSIKVLTLLSNTAVWSTLCHM